MKKIAALLLFVCLLAACSTDTENKSKKESAIEEAKKNGEIVVSYKANTFEEILNDDNVEVFNADKILELMSHVENKTESQEVTISIFNPNGKKTTNTLYYDGEFMKFENNYGGYPESPKGNFTCKFTSLRGGDIYLQMCKSDEGKEVTTMLGLIGSEDAIKEAKKAAK